MTYRLRQEARWHDGRPVTAADVIFSFETLKANSPQYAFYYKNVAKAEETAAGEVTFTFSEAGNRELPHIVGQLPVLPKHWWEGTGADGRRRNPTETTLEPPLGSGPYRLKSFDAGRSAAYERVRDYWGRDLPVNRGRHNLDEVRYEYYRDSTVLLEAFKGDRYDFRAENSARNWATAYDFPAVREGRVVREEFPVRATGNDAGLRDEPAPPDGSRTPACGAPSTSPSISRTSTARSSTASTAASTRSSPAPSLPPPGCRRARSSRYWKACATRCRRRSSPSRTGTR